jgi:hypothetical protein
MPRPTIFTPTAIARVKSLVKQGVSAAAVAAEIGCTLGTLRVRCSQLGISLRRGAIKGREQPCVTKALVRSAPGSRIRGCRTAEFSPEPMTVPMFGKTVLPNEPQVELNIFLSQVAAEQLRQQAALSGVSGATLAAELLIIISRDNLYQAVLDES